MNYIHDAYEPVLGRLTLKRAQYMAYILEKRLRLQYDPSITTACTDGLSILAGDWFFQCEPQTQLFVLAHEIMHCLLDHSYVKRAWIRMGGVPDDACGLLPYVEWVAQHSFDFQINDANVRFGFKLTPELNEIGICFQPYKYTWTMSEEEIYQKYYKYLEEQAGQPPTDDWQDTDTGIGNDVQATPEASDQSDPEAGEENAQAQSRRPNPDAEHKRNQELAKKLLEAVGNAAGCDPAGLTLLVEHACPTKVDWRGHIRMNLRSACGHGGWASWSRIATRSFAMGMVLPRKVKHQAGCIVVQTDVSGSIQGDERAAFATAFGEIAEQVSPRRLIILDVDAQVNQAREWDGQESIAGLLSRSDDAASTGTITGQHFRGGGGTDMTAGFAWCKEHELEPDLLITLTDGFTGYPAEHEPAREALWLITRAPTSDFPPEACGTSLRLDLAHDHD